jgi:hypothetical protein
MIRTFERCGAAAAAALVALATACSDATGPRSPKIEAVTVSVLEVTGTGFIQGGPGANRQTFAFDVQSTGTGISGRFTGTDVQENATLTTDPVLDPRTSFRALRGSSSFCNTPSHGAEFDAVGHLVEPGIDLYVDYTVKACDNGTPGTGVDTWSVDLPSRGYHRAGIVTGEITKIARQTDP